MPENPFDKIPTDTPSTVLAIAAGAFLILWNIIKRLLRLISDRRDSAGPPPGTDERQAELHRRLCQDVAYVAKQVERLERRIVEQEREIKKMRRRDDPLTGDETS